MPVMEVYPETCFGNFPKLSPKKLVHQLKYFFSVNMPRVYDIIYFMQKQFRIKELLGSLISLIFCMVLN